MSQIDSLIISNLGEYGYIIVGGTLIIILFILVRCYQKSRED